LKRTKLSRADPLFVIVEASQPNAVSAGNRDDRRGARLAGRGLAVDSETNLQFEVLFRSRNIFLVLRIDSMFCEFQNRTFFWFCELFKFAEQVLEISI
jgi:hypothetical protein